MTHDVCTTRVAKTHIRALSIVGYSMAVLSACADHRLQQFKDGLPTEVVVVVVDEIIKEKYRPLLIKLQLLYFPSPFATLEWSSHRGYRRRHVWTAGRCKLGTNLSPTGVPAPELVHDVTHVSDN